MAWGPNTPVMTRTQLIAQTALAFHRALHLMPTVCAVGDTVLTAPAVQLADLFFDGDSLPEGTELFIPTTPGNGPDMYVIYQGVWCSENTFQPANPWVNGEFTIRNNGAQPFTIWAD